MSTRASAEPASLFVLQGRPQAACPPQHDHCLYPLQSVVLELHLAKASGSRSQGSFWTSLDTNTFFLHLFSCFAVGSFLKGAARWQ